jgi:biotin transport system substrate-specific component
MKKKEKINLKDYILISLFSAIIAVSSFIYIPSPVPFTLQTLAIFCTLTILGGKKGIISIILYIFLGIIGLPVFSGFSGGIGHLAGASGGYITGFILLALIYTFFTHKNKNNTKLQFIGLIIGLITCYAFGTFWYCAIYLKNLSLQAIISSLSFCVLPFIIPDTAKLIIAVIINKKLSQIKN